VHAVLKTPFPKICRSAFKASAKIKLDFQTTKFILHLFFNRSSEQRLSCEASANIKRFSRSRKQRPFFS
jgi:hypothetical protein